MFDELFFFFLKKVLKFMSKIVGVYLKMYWCLC